MYEPRTYRHWISDKELTVSNIVVKETDLYIRATINLRRKAYKIVQKYRDILEKYIEEHPSFLTSFEPVSVGDNAPLIIRLMSEATNRVGVGPMASVAGTIAESVGNDLLTFSPEVIVENGGDIYLKSLRNRIIGIHAGNSSFTGKIGLEIEVQDTPLGICTSSGTVGHSLSFGKADAVIILAKSAILADAAATAIGNLVISSDDIVRGIEFAEGIEGLKGAIIIKNDDMGLWGEVKICQISTQ